MFADGKIMRTTTLVLECVENSQDVEIFPRYVFVQNVKKKKENVTADMHVVKPVEDNKRQNFGRVAA